MDDYEAAYKSRATDVMALHKYSPKKRAIGAVHLGGVTIECILKEIITTYHGITEWGQISSKTGEVICNPSHELMIAFNQVGELSTRLHANNSMLSYVRIIQNPIKGYINMRYVGGDIPQVRYDEWYRAYEALKQWLITQRASLLREK